MGSNARAVRAPGICTVLVAVIWGRLREHRCTSLRQSWTVSPPSIGLAVELRQVSLPFPAALAPHGIAQVTFRQQTFTNCTGSHPHRTPRSPARVRRNRFGPLGLLDNDGCDCSHHTQLCCNHSAKLVVSAAVDGKPNKSA